jgi:hypothetical protein
MTEVETDLRQNIEALQAENKRLREELEGIAEITGFLTGEDAYEMRDLARAALDGKE